MRRPSAGRVAWAAGPLLALGCVVLPPEAGTPAAAGPAAPADAAVAPAPPAPRPPPAPTRAPRTRALCCGVARLAAPDLPALAHAARDARTTAEWLRRPGASDVEVRCLTDAEATTPALLAGVQDFLAADAAADDLLVFAWAGYLAQDAGGAIVLLTHDPVPGAPEGSAIRLDALAQVLAAIPEADVLLLLDAGLGGPASGRWLGAAGGPPADRLASALAPLVARPGTAVVLAASPGTGAAESAEWGAGLLTHHWLGAAARASDPERDGWVDLADIFGPAAAGVELDAFLAGECQRPVRLGPVVDGFPVPRRYPVTSRRPLPR